MKDFISTLKTLQSFWNILTRKNYYTNNVVADLEDNLRNYLNASHVIAVASGTDALIISLKACDVGTGDEVIVPAAGFFSSASAAAWIGAKPVFVDVDLGSFNINPSLIERAITPKTKAIIAVHLNGRMADMERIMRIARRHSLFVIEDAAQAIGACYKEKPIGYYGDLACLSFNPSKILSGYGDGGTVITKSAAFAENVSMMRMYGTRFEDISVCHPIIGIASRLNPFQAAVLSVKLENLDCEINLWRRNYFLYLKFLSGISDLVLPEVSPEKDFYINGYRFVVLTEKREQLIKFLKEHKIDARNHYGTPLPFFGAFSYLEYKKGDFPAAEKIADESLVLPTDSRLNEKEIERAALLVKQFFETN